MLEAGGREAAAVMDFPDRRRQQGSVGDRLSRFGVQVLPGGTAALRRSRLQRQSGMKEGGDPGKEDRGNLQRDNPERSSLTPAMRKKYLKELLLRTGTHNSFTSVLSTSHSTQSSQSVDQDSDWALTPLEHAWMLSAVDGSFESLLEFITEEPTLLNRRDFISGYSVLHWLAKRGQDGVILRLIRHAHDHSIPLDVDARGSGGLTPLHLAAMHGHFAVIKLLVGAFGADVDAMDYAGRRAWQYLSGDAPLEMKELLGTWDWEHAHSCSGNNNNNNCGTCEEEEEEKEVVDGGGREQEVEHFERSRGNWRLGSLKKLLPSFSFLGGRS